MWHRDRDFLLKWDYWQHLKWIKVIKSHVISSLLNLPAPCYPILCWSRGNLCLTFTPTLMRNPEPLIFSRFLPERWHVQLAVLCSCNNTNCNSFLMACSSFKRHAVTNFNLTAAAWKTKTARGGWEGDQYEPPGVVFHFLCFSGPCRKVRRARKKTWCYGAIFRRACFLPWMSLIYAKQVEMVWKVLDSSIKSFKMLDCQTWFCDKVQANVLLKT